MSGAPLLISMTTTNPPAAALAVIGQLETNGAASSTPKPTATTTSETKQPALEPALPVATEPEKKRAASTAASTAPSRASIQTEDDDAVNPQDFPGEVLSNNELPSPETINRIGDYIVLDRHGKTHTFKSLYTGRSVARRVLIIFVRHFFCGVRSKTSTL